MGFERIAVLGVGLIGASFALALREKKLCEHIAGYGRTEENLIRAKERGIIDEYYLDPSRACEGADLVVLATPVERFESLAEEIRDSLKDGAVVIDVGSIKGGLVSRLEALMPQGVRYLGCHPIAGGESSGIEKSRADLFEGAFCVITKTDRSEPSVVDEISSLWKTLGSSVKYITPEEHDRIFGLVSHFPHLAAYAIVNTVGEMKSDSIELAGKGFIDTTRIALSSPGLWVEICMGNRENLLETIRFFKGNLEKLEKCLREGDAEALGEELTRARRLRESVGS
jgi:prephenate dehydrogenase